MNDLIDNLPALKEAYPFKSHFCDLSYGNGQSAKLHYLDEGTGHVILMLHGNPTWSFYFRNCVHYFKARGFGVLFLTIWAVGFLISLKIILTL